MRISFLTLAGIFVVFFSGCADSNNSEPDQVVSSSKNSLFMDWKGSDFTLDLSLGQLNNSFRFEISRETGEECTCEGIFEGGETTGRLDFNNCVPNGWFPEYESVCKSSGRVGDYKLFDEHLELCWHWPNQIDCYDFFLK